MDRDNKEIENQREDDPDTSRKGGAAGTSQPTDIENPNVALGRGTDSDVGDIEHITDEMEAARRARQDLDINRMRPGAVGEDVEHPDEPEPY